MIREHRWLLGLTGPVLVAGLAACSGGEAKEAEPEAAPEVAYSRAIPVEVETVTAAPFAEYVRVVGSVEAEHDVTVAAEEGGVVRSLLVEKGERVEAGRPIVKIDDRVLKAQVEQAAAQAALAEESYRRQERLWTQDSVGTELRYLEAKYGAEQARANLEMLTARLERTTVRAPVTGILDARLVEVGSMVAPGTPVVRLVDTDTVRVVAGVPERFARDVHPGAEARVSFDVLDGEAFEGTVDFVGAVVDERSRTFPVEVVVPNPGGQIKPGMVANVRVLRERLDAALLVSQDAVLRTEDGYVVYTVEERDGEPVAVETPVVTGATEGDRVLVESGLEPGDRIVVVGQKQVADGDRVEVVQSEGGR